MRGTARFLLILPTQTLPFQPPGEPPIPPPSMGCKEPAQRGTPRPQATHSPCPILRNQVELGAWSDDSQTCCGRSGALLQGWTQQSKAC